MTTPGLHRNVYAILLTVGINKLSDYSHLVLREYFFLNILLSQQELRIYEKILDFLFILTTVHASILCKTRTLQLNTRNLEHETVQILIFQMNIMI